MRLPRLSFVNRLLAGVGIVALIVLFCLGLVWRNHTVFWNDDYQVSILPVLTDVARSWHEGHWPLLSPYSWACGNLAGEYQYGTFSLFVNAVVVVVFAVWTDFALQAAALSIIHLAALGLGAYLLARGRRLPAALAVVVALIAALNGWEIGWGASDWFGALAADAWLPWCWWAFERAMREDDRVRGNRLWWLLPAPFVYLLLTGGFPYTVVRLILVTAWLAVRAMTVRRWRALWPLVLGWMFGLMLSAPAWISLLETIRGSSRSQGAGLGNFAWTVPLQALPGLILPDWTVNWHDFANHPSSHAALELIGGLVPLAALAAAVVCRRVRVWQRLRWDLVLLGTILLLCVLPSPGMFRWSFRWLPLLHLVLALIGARALHLTLSRRRTRWLGNAGLWAVVLTGGVWVAMIAAHTSSPDAITRNLPAWTFAVASGWFVLAAGLRQRRAWASWVPALITLASLWVAYQHMYTNAGVPIYAFGPSLTKVAPLSPDRLYLSLYREPFFEYWGYQTGPDFGAIVRPGSTGMIAGVRTLNGYSPIMPPGVGRLFDMETHGSIPEEVGRRLLREEAGYKGVLATLGVDGILIAHDYPLEGVVPPGDEWETAFVAPEGTVYHRRGGPMPSFVVTPELHDSVHPGKEGERVVVAAMSDVTLIENTRTRTILDISALHDDCAFLVMFRRPYFPGYQATLNGKPVPVRSFAGSFPAVILSPESKGRLVLEYRPRAVVWGVVAAGLTLLAMGSFAVWTRRRFRAG